MRFASLPWYDLDEVRPVTDAWWRVVARHLRAEGIADAPEQLERELSCERQWESPSLLLSQACGYDAGISSRGELQLVATPRYSAVGCIGTHYSSVLVVRADHPASTLAELRGARCVINTRTSHSGMNILRAMIAPLHARGRFFASVHQSGAHERSLQAILSGRADVAAIDCVTFALLGRHRPSALQGLRVLCGTQSVSAPPFVSSAATPPAEVEALRRGLHAALADPAGEVARRELFLEGIEVLPLSAYDGIDELERLARETGYREIRPYPALPAVDPPATPQSPPPN